MQKEINDEKQAVRREKDEAVLKARFAELERMFADRQNQLHNEEAELSRALLVRIRSSSETLATERGYPLVLAKSGELLWRREGPVPGDDAAVKVDGTDEIVRLLDASSR